MPRYYFVGQDNKSYGPVTPEEFLNYGLTPDSLVCPEGGNAWVPLSSVPGLAAYLQQRPGPPQPPYSGQGGGYGNNGQPSFPPSNYMALSILVTIFCCLPFGIVAIVKSSDVNSLWYAGRHDDSIRSARSAKKWCIYSVVASVVSMVIYFITVAVGMAVAF